MIFPLRASKTELTLCRKLYGSFTRWLNCLYLATEKDDPQYRIERGNTASNHLIPYLELRLIIIPSEEYNLQTHIYQV